MADEDGVRGLFHGQPALGVVFGQKLGRNSLRFEKLVEAFAIHDADIPCARGQLFGDGVGKLHAEDGRGAGESVKFATRMVQELFLQPALSACWRTRAARSRSWSCCSKESESGVCGACAVGALGLAGESGAKNVANKETRAIRESARTQEEHGFSSHKKYHHPR